ncbi:hypothetical protein EVAR_50882_1 [Eumeta japonica]|uniref:Uncharacterized protein n=1 Tax=Eumeta variegata TaxID=151549 RepID=A0A4C1Y8P0_EUMVA|nr:hypothetical protein EVAR_50882_1 [Eumeta japonica]
MERLFRLGDHDGDTRLSAHARPGRVAVRAAAQEGSPIRARDAKPPLSIFIRPASPAATTALAKGAHERPTRLLCAIGEFHLFNQRGRRPARRRSDLIIAKKLSEDLVNPETFYGGTRIEPRGPRTARRPRRRPRHK